MDTPNDNPKMVPRMSSRMELRRYRKVPEGDSEEEDEGLPDEIDDEDD